MTDPRDLVHQYEGADATMSSVAGLLVAAGLDGLTAETPLEGVEAALRSLNGSLNGADPLRRATVREAAVQRLKAVGFSAKLADAALGTPAADAVDELQGQAVAFADPEAWADPVEGVALLAELTSIFDRFAALPPGGSTTLALWTLHAHAQDAAFISPMLALTSPEKRCGKSTTLAVLGALVPRPLPTANITAAGVFRTVERFRPCLLVDEADTFARAPDELRGILNSGHSRPSAFVVRTVGDDFEPRTFSTWCPKALACIGALSTTLMDRAIVVPMHRRKPDEHVERLRLDRLAALEPVRRRAWRWTRDVLATLRRADPHLPATLDDRAADNWRSLVAIADLVGGVWPERARQAAVLLSGGRADDLGARVQLLTDLHALFTEKGADRLASEDIVAALVAMEDRRWPEWSKGRPLTKVGLARLLEPFGVRPTQLWMNGQKVRGYERDDFADPWLRYLPSVPVGSVESNNDATILGSGDLVGGSALPDAQPPENPPGDSPPPALPDAEGGSGGDEAHGDAWEPEP